jgi:diguanylate cyclase (GGDEF)-like protein
VTALQNGKGGDDAKGAREDAQAQAKVTRLQQEVVVAEERAVNANEALREANAQLVVSSLRAHSAHEKCEKRLIEASRASEHDELTTLPTRAVLHDRFERAIVHAKRDNRSLALLFLDLDNFKAINDTLGHGVGDQVLRDAAHCLMSAVRAGDTVSRHGGDEFVILLDGVSNGVDAAVVAEKLAAALAVKASSGDVPRLTASIGISVYPDDGDTVDALIDRADAAMYAAKKHGPGGFAFHGEETETKHKKSATTVRPPR